MSWLQLLLFSTSNNIVLSPITKVLFLISSFDDTSSNKLVVRTWVLFVVVVKVRFGMLMGCFLSELCISSSPFQLDMYGGTSFDSVPASLIAVGPS